MSKRKQRARARAALHPQPIAQPAIVLYPKMLAFKIANRVGRRIIHPIVIR